MNATMNVMPALSGWSTGYLSSYFHNKEREVNQGGNYYLGAFPQSSQLSMVCNLYHSLVSTNLTGASQLWSQRLLSIASFATIPFCLFTACVKQGNYDSLARFWNETSRIIPQPTWLKGKISIKATWIPYLPQRWQGNAYLWNNGDIKLSMPIRIPDQLGHRSIKIFSLAAEHSGKIAASAMVTGSVALIYLGNPVMGGAALTALTFNYIDNKGYLPRKVSLFAEKYFRTVGLFVQLVEGSGLACIASVCQLPFHLIPSLATKLQHRVDHCFRYAGLTGTSLEEIERPVKRPGSMTFNEIRRIFGNQLSDYQVNPAFCSKGVNDIDMFPSNDKFDELLELFDNIVDWKTQYRILLPKLADDNRFISFLIGHFPELQENELLSILLYINILPKNSFILMYSLFR